MTKPALALPAMLFLVGIAMAAGMWLTAGRKADERRDQIMREVNAEMFVQERITRDVQTYDRLGPHRTGTSGDLATTQWLESELARLNFAVRRQTFSVPTFLVEDAYVEIDDAILDAFPQFPVPTAFDTRISGRLRHWNKEESADWNGPWIALVEIEAHARNNSLSQKRLYRALADAAGSGARGIILVVHAPCDAIKILNAPLDVPAWPIPILAIGGDHVALIEQQIEADGDATLVLQGKHAQVEAHNVIAEIGPRTEKSIVVSTPQSGWFHATAERGSGMGVFLALARWASQHRPEHRFVFTSNSGHERGNYGAHLFTDHEAPTPKDTLGWFHIGANVGARDLDDPVQVYAGRYVMSDAGQLATAWRLFANERITGPIPLELGFAAGELRGYQEAGYKPTFGVFGPGPFHHCINDRLDAVEFNTVRRMSINYATMIDLLLR